jgi:hypothetical protein
MGLQFTTKARRYDKAKEKVWSSFNLKRVHRLRAEEILAPIEFFCGTLLTPLI